VVADEPPPSCHPAEGPLDDPASQQNIESRLAFDASDDFDDEIKIGGLVHELAPVVGAVGVQMLDPRPALTNVFVSRSAEFLGESDEKPFRPTDVAEPIRVFILDYFAYEVRAARAEPFKRLVDVVHGEHDAEVA
jgi:hypothetical protein